MNMEYKNAPTFNDKWVIEKVFPQKRGGFFVEAGACEGIFCSTTYVLEKHYGWRGILVEPNPFNFRDKRNEPYNINLPLWANLPNNRSNSACLNRGLSGERPVTAEFVEITDRNRVGFSGFPSFDASGEEAWWKKVRSEKPIAEIHYNKHQVVCEPLDKILRDHEAPPIIDYLSLDVEGAEWEILRSFPFNTYTFRAISIESAGHSLNALLEKNGYILVENPFSEAFHEDNYLHKDVWTTAHTRKKRY